MKRFKLISSTLLPLLFLVGCGQSGNKINSGNNYDNDPVSEITDDGSSNDFDSKYIKEAAIEIPSSFDGQNVSTIVSAGKYYLTGDYESISITAKKDSVVYIFLDGINVSSNVGIAFGSEKAITLYLVLMNNKTNSITNDFADTNAFHVKGEVHISGSGTLNIESKQKNGLKVSKDLYVSDVSLNVIGANHGVSARSLVSFDAVINTTAKAKDGIQLECDSDIAAYTDEQGFAYLINTKVTADTYGDGIQASTYIYVSGGDYNITTHGEFVSYSTANMTEYGLTTSDFKFIKQNNQYKRVATDEIRSLSSSYYALTNSVKGIKVGPIEYNSTEVTTGDYLIYIAHLAKITINSTDDCIHANYGNVDLANSNIVLDTIDDGTHADKELNVNDCSIQINSSYEGLEGKNVIIDGNKTNIISNSDDDGINAASDDVAAECNIYIKNGYLRIFASGDGVDANAFLYLQGGTVIVEGPGKMNGSLDAERIYFEGGLVFACSSNGMVEKMTATQNTFIYQGTATLKTNSEISIVDSNKNAIFTYTLKQDCNQIIFSSSSLELQSTYSIYNGTTSIASIQMTSSLTKVGSSQGGGGPRP